jgi:molybdenum cofactor synthesis domain-containing protein
VITNIEDYVSVGKALERLRKATSAGLATEAVPTTRAYGRVAASNILASSDVPASSRSHMDGFAVRAEDLRGAATGRPAVLSSSGYLGPGVPPGMKLGRGQAARVATGAPLPAGADTVIPVERLEQRGGKIFVDFEAEAGSFVFPKGGDIRKGDVIIERGQVLRAQDIGILLMLGVDDIGVFAKPKVAVLATGTELTSGKPASGKVRNSHSPVFLRLVEALGCSGFDLGIARDDPSQVFEKVRGALTESDFVITLGGTSVGRDDVVGGAVSMLHPRLKIHGIKMDRGRVTGLALVKGKPILMMPGPIQGAMTAFILFAVPIINLLNRGSQELPRIRCSLGSDWSARKRFADFTKVVYVALKGGGKVAEPIFGETESFTVLTKADAFIIVPEETTLIAKGSQVEARLLPGFSFA